MFRRFIKPAIICMLCFLANNNLLKAQHFDTLLMSLKDVEKQFIDSNLLLLAANFNIDASAALIEQAKLWDNPVLVTDQNIYSNGKFFEHSKDASTNAPLGQYFIQVQQLIKTAGKRGKLINLATTNKKLAELQFKDVLRNLKYQLRQTFFNLGYQIELKKVADYQSNQINNLLNAQEAQLKIGNISEKEYLRVKSLAESIKQDLSDLNKVIISAQSDLKSLLRINNTSFIEPNYQFTASDLKLLSIKDLVDSAKQINPSYQLQQTQIVYQQQNLMYQKALRVPDITVGPEYDLNSNYTPKYFGLSVSLPLPLFNKNQGNIKSASFNVKQQEAITKNAEVELYNDLFNALEKYKLSYAECNSTQKEFYKKYNNMFQNVLNSYQQRQINLLDFLDFLDTYQTNQKRQFLQQFNFQMAKEDLNFQVGKDIIN